MADIMDLFNTPIERANLHPRILRALSRNGIFTIGELIKAEANGELTDFRLIGKKTIQDILIFIREIEAGASNVLICEHTSPDSDLSTVLVEMHSSKSPNSILKDIAFDSCFDYDKIPTSCLNLSIRIEHTLQWNGIETLGELIRSDAKGELTSWKRVGQKSLNEIRRALQEWVINPGAKSIPNNNDEPTAKNWANIIEPFLRKIGDRKIAILLFRFGYKKITLEETASVLKVTRERVRQIQDGVAQNFYHHIDRSNAAEITKKIKCIISSLGDAFSLEKFKIDLLEEDILGKLSEPIYCSYLGEVDLFETLMCWLAIASDKKYAKEDGRLDINIESLRNATVITLEASRILDGIPPKAKRKIMRKVIFTGGIRVSDAKKLLLVPEDITLIVLDNLNMVEVRDGWFSLKSADINNKKIPLRSAGLKMLAVVNEMSFDNFYDGLCRYVNRFYETIAPPYVVAHMLQILGFNINDQNVTTIQSTTGILARSEECYINTANKYSNVVSFYEIAEEFYSQGLSLPAVSIVLHRSPISEKLDTGLYKIRGREISWDDIEAAQKRQKRISQDDEISYGLDGILRLRITVNRYAFLTGVISANRIKDLSGKWDTFYDGQPCGISTADEMYLWGLASAYKKMKVQVGDRIELAFNTWNRKLSLRKV